jgi:lipopolysaccharide export system protein LptA
MKSSAFKHCISAGCIIVVIALMTGLYAEESPKIAEDKKIRISSDSMMADSQSKFVEFVGNVKASQGDTVITADRLKIFYKEINSYI